MKVATLTIFGSSIILGANGRGLRGTPSGLGKFSYLTVVQTGYDYTLFSPDNTADAQLRNVFDFEPDFQGLDKLNPFSTVQVVDTLRGSAKVVNTTITSEASLVQSFEKGITFEVAGTIPIERRRVLQDKDAKGQDTQDGEKKEDEEKAKLPAPTLKGKFSHSQTYKELSASSKKDFFKSYMAQFTCPVKTVTIGKDNLPTLANSLVTRIFQMYDVAQYGQNVLKPMAEQIIADYGTHFLSRATIGASYTRSFTLQGRSTEASYMTDKENQNSAALSLAESASISVSNHDKHEVDTAQKFQKATSVDVETSIGLTPTNYKSGTIEQTMHDWQNELIKAGEEGATSKLGLIVLAESANSLTFTPICDLFVWAPYVETQFKLRGAFAQDATIDESLLLSVREALYRAIYTKCADCAEPKNGKSMYKDQTITADNAQKWVSKVWKHPYNGHSQVHTPTTQEMFGNIGGFKDNKVNQAVYIDSISVARTRFENYSQKTVNGIRINYQNVENNNMGHSSDIGYSVPNANDVENTAHIGGLDIVEVQVYSGDLLEGLIFVLNDASRGQTTTECIGNCGHSNVKSFKAPMGGRLISFSQQCMDDNQNNSHCTMGTLAPVWAV